jgi:hypothetical protein
MLDKALIITDISIPRNCLVLVTIHPTMNYENVQKVIEQYKKSSKGKLSFVWSIVNFVLSAYKEGIEM